VIPYLLNSPRAQGQLVPAVTFPVSPPTLQRQQPSEQIGHIRQLTTEADQQFSEIRHESEVESHEETQQEGQDKMAERMRLQSRSHWRPMFACRGRRRKHQHVTKNRQERSGDISRRPEFQLPAHPYEDVNRRRVKKSDCVTGQSIQDGTHRVWNWLLEHGLYAGSVHEEEQENAQTFPRVTSDQEIQPTQSKVAQFNQENRGLQTKSEDKTVQGPEPTKEQEDEKERGSNAGDQSDQFIEHDSERERPQGFWKISEGYQTQGFKSNVPTNLSEESQPIAQAKTVERNKENHPIVQRVNIPEQIPQRPRNEGMQPDDPSADLAFQLTDAEMYVVCPFGMLPYSTCPWVGQSIERMEHVQRCHDMHVEYSDNVALTSNDAIILIAHEEMFLCYSYLHPITSDLYCIAQLANTWSIYNNSYKYVCELYTFKGDRLSHETRVVALSNETFYKLLQPDRCVRFGSRIIKQYVDEEIIVTFKIICREGLNVNRTNFWRV
jgi:hypothetical protein